MYISCRRAGCGCFGELMHKVTKEASGVDVDGGVDFECAFQLVVDGGKRRQKIARLERQAVEVLYVANVGSI